MGKNKVIELKKPGGISEDPLTELLRIGAQRLIADAVEAELQELLSSRYEITFTYTFTNEVVLCNSIHREIYL